MMVAECSIVVVEVWSFIVVTVAVIDGNTCNCCNCDDDDDDEHEHDDDNSPYGDDAPPRIRCDSVGDDLIAMLYSGYELSVCFIAN
jgi:hypothetical protein